HWSNGHRRELNQPQRLERRLIADECRKLRPRRAAGGSTAVFPAPQPLQCSAAGNILSPDCCSGKASSRFGACIGTMNRDEAAAGALASWTAAVLCRFCARGPDPKAPEDWRTPKPRAVPAGSWRDSGGKMRIPFERITYVEA